MSNTLLDSVFPLTDEPLNSKGERLYILEEASVSLIRTFISNLVKYKIVPALRNHCQDDITELCALTTMSNLPWPEAAMNEIRKDIHTSCHLIFSPSNFRQYLKTFGFTTIDKGAARVILRVIQWVSLAIYQDIQDYKQNVMGSKLLIDPIKVLEALREDEIICDILRGLMLKD